MMSAKVFQRAFQECDTCPLLHTHPCARSGIAFSAVSIPCLWRHHQESRQPTRGSIPPATSRFSFSGMLDGSSSMLYSVQLVGPVPQLGRPQNRITSLKPQDNSGLQSRPSAGISHVPACWCLPLEFLFLHCRWDTSRLV